MPWVSAAGGADGKPRFGIEREAEGSVQTGLRDCVVTVAVLVSCFLLSFAATHLFWHWSNIISGVSNCATKRLYLGRF